VASRTISIFSISVSLLVRVMRRKPPYFLPPSYEAAPHFTKLYTMVNAIFTLIHLNAASYSVSRRALKGARPRPKGPHWTPLLSNTPTALPRTRARGSGRTRMCSDGSERAGQTLTDGADRQGQGQPDLACQISAAKTGRQSLTVFGDGPLEAGWQVCLRSLSAGEILRTACGPDLRSSDPGQRPGSPPLR